MLSGIRNERKPRESPNGGTWRLEERPLTRRGAAVGARDGVQLGPGAGRAPDRPVLGSDPIEVLLRRMRRDAHLAPTAVIDRPEAYSRRRRVHVG
jgi:hypothetical protein